MGSPTPTIKLLCAFRHGEFHPWQSTGLTRERTKMTISCDIPTQMIVDDSSSSSSSPEQTNNLAEAMKARRRKKKKRSPMVGNTFTDLYKLTGQSLGEGSYGKVENCVNVFTGIEYAVKIIEKDLEDFASRAMAVNRAVGANSMERMEPVQVKRAAFSFDLSPPNLSNCGLMARRRRSKENFQRFCSIDEVEPDAFMRTIH